MNKLHLELVGTYMELVVTGLESPSERWLMVQGSWQIGGRKMSGYDPAVELTELVEFQKDVKKFLNGTSNKIESRFMEPNLKISIDKTNISIRFLPESSIWHSYPRPEAEKIIYGEIPTFTKPYNEKDVKALLAWTQAVIQDIESITS